MSTWLTDRGNHISKNVISPCWGKHQKPAGKKRHRHRKEKKCQRGDPVCKRSLSLYLSVLMPLGTSWQHHSRESNSPHSWQSVPHRARWRRSMERRAQHHRMAIPSHLGPSDSAIPLFWMQLLQYLQKSSIIFNHLQYISTIFYRDSVTEMSRLFTQGPRVQLS